MKKITFVTGNMSKINSARQILEPLGIEVDHIKMDTEEIQSDSTEEIAKHSAKEACDNLKIPVIKNDIGLYVEALNGFPGPYTHYVDDKLGEDGILKLLNGVENRRAYFLEAIAYCEYGKEPITFISKTMGTISKRKSGKYGWSWDSIFIPDGYNKTLGNYKDEERCLMWDTNGYQQFANYLNNKKQ